MPVAGVIRNLVHEITKRSWEGNQIQQDPSSNPKWLERNQDEISALRECEMLLRKLYLKWPYNTSVKKKLSTNKTEN